MFVVNATIIRRFGFSSVEGPMVSVELYSKVGKGSYSVVCSCKFPYKDDNLVLKRIRYEVYEEGGEIPPDIQSELNGLEATGSEYLLVVYEKRYCLLLPNLGEDLYKISQQTPRFDGKTLVWLVSLLNTIWSTLKSLHDQGFLHGDVKPNNIVHDGKKMHLIDFGLCSAILKPISTNPGAYMHLSPAAQFGLPHRIINDTRAFLVLVIHMICNGECYRYRTVTKNGTLYKFWIMETGLQDDLKEKLKQWPKLRECVLAAYQHVLSFDERSMYSIEHGTKMIDLEKELANLDEKFLDKFKAHAEKILTVSADSV